MTLRAPISTRTDKLFPDTTLFRSARPVRDFVRRGWRAAAAQARGDDRVADPSGRIQGQILAADRHDAGEAAAFDRSEEHTSELQSLMRISYAVFCLKKKHEQDTISMKITTENNSRTLTIVKP